MEQKQYFLIIKKLSLLFLILSVSLFVTSNALDNNINKPKKQKLPTFDDFLVVKIYKGIPAKVDLSSNRYAKEFRTALREGAKKGPNFAGHYTLIEWGCGSFCQNHAIVDAKNGKVFFPGKLLTMAGVDFKLTSSLIITDPVNTLSVDVSPISYSYYYNWDGKKLILIDSLKIQ